MDMSEVFSSETISASDLKGRPVTLTIAGVAVVEFDDGRKPKIEFRETDKTMIVNKTNTNTIIDIHGADSDGWIGKKITLIPTQTDFQGKQVPCIRVQLPATQVAADADGSADIPF